jgi:ferric-dicitrate binding protein FerR (iron transport regulator)
MNIEKQNIDELLIAYLLGELDTETSLQVEAWIAESDEHRQQFEATKQIWDASENTMHLNFDSNMAWDKVAPKITIKKTFNRFYYSAAAVILLLVSSVFVFTFINQETQTYTLQANLNLENDTLIDGSIIKLNKNSSITYSENFNENIRELSMEGEAFFDIKRDTSKAFIINIENTSRVEVLGTSFNIKSTDDYTDVYVKSGLVKFEYQTKDTLKAYQSILLKAGEKVKYNKLTNELIQTKDSLLNAVETYWMDRKLTFDGIKLKKVVKILEVVYDVNIELADSAINDCLLTVSFDNEEISQILEVLANTFELEIEQNGDQYLFKGQRCEKE